jgi:hypothetical protein
LAATALYWQAKSRVAVLAVSPFETASAYWTATDAAGERVLDVFFEDAAFAGETAKMSAKATAIESIERHAVPRENLIMSDHSFKTIRDKAKYCTTRILQSERGSAAERRFKGTEEGEWLNE